MIKTFVALLFLAGLSAPALAADQFDLICTAKKQTNRFRIDLARMEYCEGSCENVNKIHEVTSGLITLSKTEPQPGNAAQGWNTVNRVTGEWWWYFSSPASYRVMDIRGACQPAEFSGMPTAKF